MELKVKENNLFIVNGIRVPINRFLYIRRPTSSNEIKIEKYYFDLLDVVGDTILVGCTINGLVYMFLLSNVYETEADAQVLKAIGYEKE